MTRIENFLLPSDGQEEIAPPAEWSTRSEDWRRPARIENAQAVSEKCYRLTIDLSPMIPWVADSDGRILEIDARIFDNTGFKPEECLGENFLNAIHADDRQIVLDVWRQAKGSGQPFDYDVRMRSRDGGYRWFRSRAFSQVGGKANEPCWFGTVEDVHARKMAEEAIRWAADHDELTGILNRRGFLRELHTAFSKAVDTSAPLTLVLIDLDHFKPINDRFGHDVGDKLLGEIAGGLSNILPASGFVGRMGGDEFAICLQGAHGDVESPVVAQVQAICTQCYRYQGLAHELSASIGVAMFPRDAENPDALYKSADLALYEAKSGTGIVRNFDGSMRERHQLKLSTFAVVRDALKDGRVFPYYQPKVDLHTGEIVGFEALLRWEHERHGLQSAATIAAAFQDAELALALDRHMFECIARDIGEWRAHDIPFGRIAINTSLIRFQAANVARELLDRIAESGLEPHLLELEITEDVLIGQSPEALSREIDRLRAEGLTVALDDFGTGFASLVHLKQFAIDVLKIDRSFIQNLSDPTNAAIVAALVRLGSRLSIKTVAEGIESVEQADLLHRKGCNIGQGFLFSPAVSADAVPGLIAELVDVWTPAERRIVPERRLSSFGRGARVTRIERI